MPEPEVVHEAPPSVHLDMPGHLLRRCHQIAVAVFMNECRSLDLTPLQFVALSALNHHGAMDHATLGGAAALDRTTVAVVVKNLTERGLVSTERSKADRRSKIIAITDAGRALFQSALPAVETAQKKILEPLSQAERETLVALLGKLALKNNTLSRAPIREV
ncbi:MAG: MarR family winged helix-turn-helix transcriptional regulator [Hyphomicrobiales bacterium]